MKVRDCALKRQGHVLAYVVINPDLKTRGNPMVLLHGAGVDGRLTWQPLVELCSWERTIIIPDFRHTGLSINENGEINFSIAAIAEDIVAILNHEGIQELDVIGYSLGALVSIELLTLIDRYINSLTLIEPPGVDPILENQILNAEKFKLASDEIIQHNTFELFLGLTQPESGGLHPRAKALMIERLEQNSDGLGLSLLAVSEYLRTPILCANTSFKPRTTALLGSKSQTRYLNQTKAWLDLQHIPWFTIPGADHTMPFQKPRRIIQHIEEKLNG